MECYNMQVNRPAMVYLLLDRIVINYEFDFNVDLTHHYKYGQFLSVNLDCTCTHHTVRVYGQ